MKVAEVQRPALARTGAAVALAIALSAVGVVHAGQGQRGAGAAPPSARASAPVDLTGYWVSIVTEDWIERMAPDSPPSGVLRGGRGGFPGGAQTGAPPPTGKPDPCRAYGAAGSLRVPGRLNVSWLDDNTLKIDLDAGTQTRLLRFAPGAPPAARTLQGHSVAEWDLGPARGRGGRGGGRGGAPAAPPAWGSLKVVTTNMTPGYLLSSRSFYGEDAVLTEHFTRHGAFGDEYFTVTAIVEDGAQARITSSTFKKEPDGSKFSPTGCDIVR